MNPFENKKIHVIGAAKSGLAVARFLKQSGADVFVSEKESADKRKSEAGLLAEMKIECEFGAHSDRLLSADMIVISPGVPMNIPILKKIREQGIPVYSELEIASWVLNSPIVAITGSNGKTTTTTLIGEIFRESGRPTIVAGNVGTPLSELVHTSVHDGVAVLEVSSFQLETISEFTPDIAMITNFFENHLDRYPSYRAYIDAKKRIALNMGPKHWLILNADQQSMR